jgi:Ulp1 family protease
VPQQDNLCDCGLFLLHYFELFIDDPPAIFDYRQVKYKVRVLF